MDRQRKWAGWLVLALILVITAVALGVTYAAIDRYLLTGEAEPGDLRRIQKYHGRSGHKRKLPPVYPEE